MGPFWDEPEQWLVGIWVVVPVVGLVLPTVQAVALHWLSEELLAVLDTS